MTPTERLTIVRIGANAQGLERAAGAYLAFVSRCRVPDDIRVDMYVALDEIVSNLVRHGSPTGPVDRAHAVGRHLPDRSRGRWPAVRSDEGAGP